MDIETIRKEPEKIKKEIARKGADPALVDEVILIDRNRRRILPYPRLFSLLARHAFMASLSSACRTSRRASRHFPQRLHHATMASMQKNSPKATPIPKANRESAWPMVVHTV